MINSVFYTAKIWYQLVTVNIQEMLKLCYISNYPILKTSVEY